MWRLLKRAVVLAVFVILAMALATAYWIHRPLPFKDSSAEMLDLTIAPGSSAKTVAHAIHAAGIDVPASAIWLWFRVSGESSQIKAGSYEIEPGTTLQSLLDKLVKGEQAIRKFTLVEGWNYRQVLRMLKTSDHIRWDLPDTQDPVALASFLGIKAGHMEGRLLPDTYLYPKNSRASDVLKQAAKAMEERLQALWTQRANDLPLKSPEEALILASLIEKETGLPADRGEIAGVFINRLRIGMRLQTDPSVIYGRGKDDDLRLRRVDLETDTPYNTYTRAGLPPTPIAMPGVEALKAAVQPRPTKAMYFVSRGDGSSHFSATLDEHNAAVNRYILKR